MNKVILIGNVGKDPERKDFQNGSIANFTLATNEVWKDQNGEKKTATEWHNIVVNGKTVDVVMSYVKKGDKLAIEGKVKTRSYENENGETRTITEIKATQVEMLTPKQT